MAAESEDAAHRARLRKEYKRRLYVLELRQARQGDSADPAVLTEIEELRASLALLDLADAPKPTPEARAALGSESISDLAIAQLGKFGERLTGVETKVTEVREEANVWRETHGREHQADVSERRRGQRFRLIVESGAVAVLVVLLRGAQINSSGVVIIVIATLAIIGIGVIWWLADHWWRNGR